MIFSSKIPTLEVERFRAQQQIGTRYQIQSDGPHPLALLLGEAVMMTEQMKPGPHRGEDFIDGGLTFQ